VGKATWYALVRLYTAVTRLSELRSQGQQFYSINWEYPDPIQEGDTGDKVRHLQYMLSVLSAYIRNVPSVTVDGIFGPATRDAVVAAQRWLGLPETGQVDDRTWDEIYDQFSGIETASWRDPENFPYTSAVINQTQPRTRYSRTTTQTQFPGTDLRTGNQDPVRQEVVR
jgi:peptidoglycan hydrolase-like protein with peptidoglycan-binding domain